MALGEQKPHKDEKTEPPSKKRMSQQRADGNVFMSQEMATVIVVFCGAWVLRFLGPWIFQNIYQLFLSCFSHISWFRPTPENINNYIVGILLLVCKLLLPVILLLMLVGIFSTLVQTGWSTSMKRIKWKWDRLFQFKWSALLPDKKKACDLFINIAKIILLCIVLFHSLKKSVDSWIPLMDGPVINVWFHMCHEGFKVVMKISFVMFLLALIDFFYKRKEWLQDLKMTKWEVKEERKQAEGDPKIKAALKSKRFAFFRKIMMQAVPQADVIITNPTHIAVAIKYDSETMEAPKVMAKGVRKLAEKIKELAKKNDIPIVENKPLAQVLFKTVEVGSYIPVSLYKAVAEVLAYVYKLKNKFAA